MSNDTDLEPRDRETAHLLRRSFSQVTHDRPFRPPSHRRALLAGVVVLVAAAALVVGLLPGSGSAPAWAAIPDQLGEADRAGIEEDCIAAARVAGPEPITQAADRLQLAAVDVRGQGGFAVLRTPGGEAPFATVTCTLERDGDRFTARVATAEYADEGSTPGAPGLVNGASATINGETATLLQGSLEAAAVRVTVTTDRLGTAEATLLAGGFAVWLAGTEEAVARAYDGDGSVIWEITVPVPAPASATTAP
jgi:hypothetical protein